MNINYYIILNISYNHEATSMIEIKHVELDRESLKITTENLFYTLKKHSCMSVLST